MTGVLEFPAAEFMVTGSPELVQSSAGRWADFGSSALDAAGEITSLDTTLFEGPEGDQYRRGLSDQLVTHLVRTGGAYAIVGTALAAYAVALRTAQDAMTPLAIRARALWAELTAAEAAVTTATLSDQSHNRARAHHTEAQGDATPDIFVSAVPAATTALTAAQQAWDACHASARQVHATLASVASQSASAIRGQAGQRFAQNPHGLGRIGVGLRNAGAENLAGLRRLGSDLKRLYIADLTLQYNLTGDIVNAIASGGQSAGHNPVAVAELFGGMALTYVGANVESGGVVLDCTVVGIPEGLALNAVGAAAIAGGAALSINGSLTISQDARGPYATQIMHQRATPKPAPKPAPNDWGDKRTLQSHFDDHGGDFASPTPEAYSKSAHEFLLRAITEKLPIKVDEQGVIRAYDPKTNTFGSYNPDGTTKTFFKPSRRAGYWNDQPGRSR